MGEVKLTERQFAVLNALHRYGQQQPGLVAARAFIRTTSPRETAARHLIRVESMGLAERRGTRRYPEWCITEAGRAALEAEASPNA